MALEQEHIKDLRMCGELTGAYLRQIRDLEAERDALAAENVRLREALVLAEENLTHMLPGYALKNIRATLSSQPSTASPNAPEGVSGDSERTCATCRWWEKLRSQRYCEPWPCMYCWDNPGHPHWEAKP